MNALPTPLVSVDWLLEHLKSPNVRILNATIAKAVGAGSTFDIQIPNSHFFDIKNSFSDTSSRYPNTFPSAKQFELAAQKLGINQDSKIVIYDEHGIYSSPRAWWMFQAFGHRDVAVLDGGFPAWLKANFLTEAKSTTQVLNGNFKATLKSGYIKNYAEVLNSINNEEKTILDARAATRFGGHAPEPRAGVRSGHIPSSLNQPYTDLLNDQHLLPKAELKSIFDTYEHKELIMSCGSGITACILALGAQLADHPAVSIYDGSWSEWGSIDSLPIEKDAN